MDNWDEEKLMEVVSKKHGDANESKTKTEIVSYRILQVFIPVQGTILTKLKAHCPTCSYLLPLYRKLPQSVPVGPPWSSFSYVKWELS